MGMCPVRPGNSRVRSLGRSRRLTCAANLRGSGRNLCGAGPNLRGSTANLRNPGPNLRSRRANLRNPTPNLRTGVLKEALRKAPEHIRHTPKSPENQGTH